MERFLLLLLLLLLLLCEALFLISDACCQRGQLLLSSL
jgi:hypothetical protein